MSHHPTIFPSEKTLQQRRVSNGEDKTAKDGKKEYRELR